MAQNEAIIHLKSSIRNLVRAASILSDQSVEEVFNTVLDEYEIEVKKLDNRENHPLFTTFQNKYKFKGIDKFAQNVGKLCEWHVYEQLVLENNDDNATITWLDAEESTGKQHDIEKVFFDKETGKKIRTTYYEVKGTMRSSGSGLSQAQSIFAATVKKPDVFVVVKVTHMNPRTCTGIIKLFENETKKILTV